MKAQDWITQMVKVASDFDLSDDDGLEVKSFIFKPSKTNVICFVTIGYASGEEITWELINDGVSAGLWQKVSA